MVDGVLLEKTPRIGSGLIGCVSDFADIVRSLYDRDGSRLGRIRSVIAERGNVENSVAVTDNVLVPVYPIPVVADDVIQEVIVRTCWNAVDGIVRAHERSYLRVASALLKRRKVVLSKILGVDERVIAKAVVIRALLNVIAGEMLACGNHLLDLWINATFQTKEQLLRIA